MRAWIFEWWNGGEALEPPGDGGFWLFTAGLAAFALWVASVEFVPVVDHANLAFHEAGHLLFRVFGDTASLYGGTLMQFVFPSVTSIRFLHRGQMLSGAACAVWFCENLHYTALYAGDARAQNLPLVGGGEHDWFNILSRWHALESDTTVAGVFEFGCWIGMLTIWFLVWRAWRHARP